MMIILTRVHYNDGNNAFSTTILLLLSLVIYDNTSHLHSASLADYSENLTNSLGNNSNTRAEPNKSLRRYSVNNLTRYTAALILPRPTKTSHARHAGQMHSVLNRVGNKIFHRFCCCFMFLVFFKKNFCFFFFFFSISALE